MVAQPWKRLFSFSNPRSQEKGNHESPADAASLAGKDVNKGRSDSGKLPTLDPSAGKIDPSTGSGDQGAPPPYSAPSSHNSREQHTVGSSIPICPHDNLSAERFDRIISLPKFSISKAKLDALTPGSQSHSREHGVIQHKGQYRCQPLRLDNNTREDIPFIEGYAAYSYAAPGPTFSNGGPGLQLFVRWTIKAGAAATNKTHITLSGLDQLLKHLCIPLCAHKTMHDPEITSLIYPILFLEALPADPIDQWLAKEVYRECASCGTKIKIYLMNEGGETSCRVLTKRIIARSEGGLEVHPAVWEAGE